MRVGTRPRRRQLLGSVARTTTLGVDVEVGGGNSGPRNLTPVGNRLFFTATRAAGVELFTSDGTANGTLQFDLQAGSNGSNPDRLTALGNRVLCTASDASNGLEVWRSDGTVGGTGLLLDFQPGITSSFFDGFATLGNVAFFSANVPGAGIELCRTDGTPAGTALFADLQPGLAGARPNGFVTAGNRVFFRAFVSGQDVVLWVTDGSVAGTRVVLDLPGTLSAHTSTLKPGGSLILSKGTSAALVAVSLPAKGAKVDVAMLSGMPCFHAGAGAAAGACACAVAASMDIETSKPTCLNWRIILFFKTVSLCYELQLY